MAYLLSSQAVLICPHGGAIQHVPNTFTTYRLNGYPPLLLTDTYIVAGCGFTYPCHQVQWLNGSATMMIKGIPVLTVTSTGLCLSTLGTPGGPVVVASPVNVKEEPREFTNIDQ